MKRASIGLAYSLGVIIATSTAARGVELGWSDNPTCAPNKPPAVDFFIRADFNDLGPTVCPSTDPFQVIGATISATNNLLTAQNSGALDGLAALTFNIYGSAASQFLGLSAGLFVQGNDTYQFQSSPSQPLNADTVTYGGFTQLVLNNDWIGGGGFDTFRIRVGEVTASSGTSWTSQVGEWIPAYRFGNVINFGTHSEIGSTPFYYVLAPEIMVQDDQYVSGPNKYLIFATHSESLRVGPQVVLQLTFGKEALLPYVDPKTADFLAATFATITFHASTDVYSGRDYSWTAVSLTHTFTPYLGITATYGTGNSEATGNLTRQVKAGLSVKF
jgi:hypothetical protein